jgi:xylulokinase
MAILLGIDLGTSSVKCILADENGNIISSAEREYSISTPKLNWAEQDPADWWNMTCQAVREVIAKLDANQKDHVHGIGLSGQMHGTVFLDKDNSICRPAIIWADQRSDQQCKFVYNKLGKQRLADITGSGIFPGFMLASLLWVQENQPKIWGKVSKVIFPKDYIRFQLIGDIATDISDASSGLLVDNSSRTWSETILEEVGLSRKVLPNIIGSHQIAGELTKRAAESLNLQPGIPVVTGASDQATGALGSGLITPDVVSATIGTGGQLVSVINEAKSDHQLRIHTFCHAVPDQWYLLGATLSAGLAFRWLRDSILGYTGSGTYDRMVKQAEDVQPGSEGLLFFPYLVGERSVLQENQPKGMFYGLSLRHQHPHLIRSAMEGIIFSLRQVLDVFVDMDVKTDQIIASGGGSRSQLWCQIMADVFQTPVARLKIQEQSAIGAVILAGLGTGIFTDQKQASERYVKYEPLINPRIEVSKIYNDSYNIYKKLYANSTHIDSQIH